MKTLRYGTMLASAGLTLAASGTAMAQDEAGTRSGSRASVETMVITATKKEEDIGDVGQTVNAVSGDDVREMGLDNVEDIIGLVPGTGFFNSAGGGVPVVIIRGVGLQNFRINDTPTTAVYVDDVYQVSVAQATSTIFDVERVEVLKGPQAGLYGRNAVGGAIQIISARPNFDQFESSLSVNYQEYDQVEGEAVVSGPVTDDLAFRLAGKVVNSDDTQFHSTTGNFDHGEQDRWAGRGLLEFRPADGVNLLFKVHGGADDSEIPFARPIGIFEPLGLGLGAMTGVANTADGAILNANPATTSMNNICSDIRNGRRNPSRCETLNGQTPDELGIGSRYDSASTSRPQLDNAWWGVSLQAEVEFDDYTVTSISAYDEFDHGRYIDQDSMPTRQQEIDYNSKLDILSQEFRLRFDDGGPFTWLIGTSYAEDDLNEDSILFADDGILNFTLGGQTRAAQQYEQTTEAWSVFARSDWRFADPFNLVLEARYTNEEKGFDGSTFLPQAGVTLASTDDTTSFDLLGGKVSLEYSATDNTLVYGSVSEGFKSGGYFGGFATNNAQLEPFDEETILAYELGFKADLPAQAMRVNGSVFYYDREDVQANGLDTTGVVNINRLTNVGDVEAYGLELETIWRPLDQIFLQAGLSWLDSEIVESDKTTSNLFRTSTTESFVGARIPHQPEFSGNLIARYEDDVTADLLGSLQMEYSYRGELDRSLVVNPTERVVVTEDGYSLVNLRAGIGPSDRKWRLSAYVTNLFDEDYRTNATGTGPAGAVEIFGDPRIYGVGIDYRLF